MEWISIEDALPENNQLVLICDVFSSFVCIGRYKNIENENYFQILNLDEIEDDSEVTHWMPLPESPKE